MKVSNIKTLLEGDLVTGENLLDFEVEYGYGCDLMSDVLAFVKHNVVLLTGLVNPQVIRTAEILDIHVIVFVRGKEPSEEIIEMAKERGMAIMLTQHSLYTSCAILNNNGLLGEEITHED